MTSPIVFRVLRGAPEAIAAIIVLWIVGEIVGALAARRIALGGAGVTAALRDSMGALARRPVPIAFEFLVPTAAMVLVLLPSTVTASEAWGLVRPALRSGGDPLGATLAVVLFVALWLVGLLLLAVTAAWRSAVWSVAHRQLWTRRVDSAGSAPG